MTRSKGSIDLQNASQIDQKRFVMLFLDQERDILKLNDQ